MDYFYCPAGNLTRGIFSIDGDEFSHLVHVMRKKEGDLIRIVDGVGNAYDARIDSVKMKSAGGSLIKKYERHHEPQVYVTLAAGMLKNYAKFDFLVEKTTELGIREIIPLRTERTIPVHAKTSRWQKLVLAAMKQSGRSFLPIVSDVMTLDELLSAGKRFDYKFVAHEQRIPASVAGCPPFEESSSVLIVVGPEGGFSDPEIDDCLKRGFLPLFLGERRLRSETAAIVAMALTILSAQ
jgi:16S rRNA (uracil1498-N3)-methyltransferase